jgi:hypothetical protein
MEHCEGITTCNSQDCQMSARNSASFGAVKRAAAKTAALRRLQNGLGNSPLATLPSFFFLPTMSFSAIRRQGSTLRIGIQRGYFRQKGDQEHHRHIASGELVVPSATFVEADVSPFKPG